jgi:PTS system fructose-specific IIA component
VERLTVERLVDPQLVLFDVEADSKEQVIRVLSERLLEAGRINDLEGYVSAVLEREGSSSTAVGFSVATPHAKSEFVSQATIGFARLSNELAWDDEETVRLVFLIAVPMKDKGDRHLQILAKLFRKLMDEDFLATISEATNAGDIVALIEDIS